jgi:hypothetical protein
MVLVQCRCVGVMSVDEVGVGACRSSKAALAHARSSGELEESSELTTILARHVRPTSQPPISSKKPIILQSRLRPSRNSRTLNRRLIVSIFYSR